MNEDWQASAASASAGVRSVWIRCMLGAFAGGGALALGIATHGPVRWAALTVGIAITLWTFVIATVAYMRRIDEQERTANLWATYVGLCTYLMLYVVGMLARKLGQPIPNIDMITFIGVIVVTYAVFAWKRFR